jgi:hypothetical protein
MQRATGTSRWDAYIFINLVLLFLFPLVLVLTMYYEWTDNEGQFQIISQKAAMF